MEPDPSESTAVHEIHFLRSSYREMLIEHLFAGELMRHYWQRKESLLEVAKPQVDDGGYDLIIEANGEMRHVQLKSSHQNSRLRETNVALSLANKPGGCVIVVRFEEESLKLGPFHFFGGRPGEPMPDIRGYKVTRNTRRNKEGGRNERPAHRTIPLSKFEVIPDIFRLAERLFGG
jgi:hypothetical protein